MRLHKNIYPNSRYFLISNQKILLPQQPHSHLSFLLPSLSLPFFSPLFPFLSPPLSPPFFSSLSFPFSSLSFLLSPPSQGRSLLTRLENEFPGVDISEYISFHALRNYGFLPPLPNVSIVLLFIVMVVSRS